MYTYIICVCISVGIYDFFMRSAFKVNPMLLQYPGIIRDDYVVKIVRYYCTNIFRKKKKTVSHISDAAVAVSHAFASQNSMILNITYIA